MFSIEGLVLEAGLVAMMNATMTAKSVQVTTREKVDRSRECMKYGETVPKVVGRKEIGREGTLMNCVIFTAGVPIFLY